MDSKIQAILQSKLKPKEKLAAKEFIGFFQAGSDVEKGTCADVMKHVSKEKPEILAPYINILIEYINYKVARVKWGVPEAIGNMAQKSKLLLNTKDPSTVIKWCAAYGLTEIAKNNPKTHKQLLPIFSGIAKQEKNNGVKNVYIKALKIIEKN